MGKQKKDHQEKGLPLSARLWPEKAYGIQKKSGGYVLTRYTIEDGRIIGVDEDEPNLQGVVLGKLEIEMLRDAHKDVY